MKSIYDRLKQEFKTQLESQEELYPFSVKALKQVLQQKEYWSQLTIEDVNRFILYTDRRLFETKQTDLLYGTEFLNPEKTA